MNVNPSQVAALRFTVIPKVDYLRFGFVA
jgi:hypothetical protein